MKFRFISILVLFWSSSLYAESGTPQTEIKHLLAFVQNSSCAFIRNGTSYDSQNAVEHIQKKYDHYKKDISKAEDFIDLAATQSLMTRKKYHVLCPGEEAKKTSASWLYNELKRYRNGTIKG